MIFTPLGPISVLVEDGKVVRIELGRNVRTGDVPQSILRQIEEYLAGLRKELDFEVQIVGTCFQKRVWEEVRKIPYGEVRTYGEIAKKLGTSPRAVGRALAENPLPLYIPCHRVVAKNKLGGFSAGLEWKEYLLRIERGGA